MVTYKTSAAHYTTLMKPLNTANPYQTAAPQQLGANRAIGASNASDSKQLQPSNTGGLTAPTIDPSQVNNPENTGEHYAPSQGDVRRQRNDSTPFAYDGKENQGPIGYYADGPSKGGPWYRQGPDFQQFSRPCYLAI